MTPYYDHAGITIYHGDCREVLPTLRNVGVVIADPPYGVSMARGDGRVKRPVYGDNEPFEPAHLLVYPCAIFGANVFADKLPPSTGWLVWDKTHHDKSEHSQAELAWTNFVRGIRIYREAYHGFMRKLMAGCIRHKSLSGYSSGY